MSVQHGPGQQTASILTTPRSFLAAILSVACVFSVGIPVPSLSAAPAAPKDKKVKKDPALKNLPITELSADEAILHALNRLAYGPRPGDMEHIRQMGLAKWIDQQLNPSSVDDKALDARLEDFPTLKMSSAKLMEEYPRPKQVEKQASQRAQAQIEQDQQRRSDVAAAIVSKDMLAAPAPTETAAMDPKEAAAHLLGNIKEAAQPVLAQGRDAVVSVILDGENAWEYYPKSGREFLRRFYDGLQNDPGIEAVTVSEAIGRHRDFGAMNSLTPGSWISANFNVWIEIGRASCRERV